IAIFPIVVANIYYQLNEITFFSPFSWLDILLIDGTRGGIYPALGQLVTVMLVVMISCGYMLYKKVKRVDFVWTQEQ
ncbi:MAG: hypothetical protein R3Y24_11060, partial [Eubacteriales bacterium]